MKLYLMRHGEYVSSSVRKPLTAKGAASVERMSRYLKERGDCIDEIWHSPKTRAAESAKVMAKVFQCANIHEKEFLTPNAPAEETLAQLEGCLHNTVIVSHLPLIPRLLSRLFPEKMAVSFSFPTAAVAMAECIDGRWEFCEVITLDCI